MQKCDATISEQMFPKLRWSITCDGCLAALLDAELIEDFDEKVTALEVLCTVGLVIRNEDGPINELIYASTKKLRRIVKTHLGIPLNRGMRTTHEKG